MIIGPSSDYLITGGAPADYIWEEFTLQSTEILTLEFNGNILSTFDPTLGTIEPGFSWQFANNVWCSSSEPFGLGDWGTPGVENSGC